jgi:hypothetical protein
MKKNRILIACFAAFVLPLALLAQPYPISLRIVTALEAAWAILGGAATVTGTGAYDLQLRTAIAAEGIQSSIPRTLYGTNIISGDSTVTNTFTRAFTTAPFVTLTRFTAGTITNAALVSVSTTNFIAWGQTNSPFHWHAIGAP